MNSGGKKMIRVKGTTDSSITEETEYKEEIYTLNAIYYNGNLSIGSKLTTDNGEELELEGLSYNTTNSTWTCGTANDIGTTTVLLKVEGDLIIEEGKTLTGVASRGIIIYCGGKFSNFGTIDMNGKGCSSYTQDVFLYKQIMGNYITISASGENGGKGVYFYQAGNGNKGSFTNCLIKNSGGGGFSAGAGDQNGGIGTSYGGGHRSSC